MTCAYSEDCAVCACRTCTYIIAHLSTTRQQTVMLLQAHPNWFTVVSQSALSHANTTAPFTRAMRFSRMQSAGQYDTPSGGLSGMCQAHVVDVMIPNLYQFYLARIPCPEIGPAKYGLATCITKKINLGTQLQCIDVHRWHKFRRNAFMSNSCSCDNRTTR